MMKTLTRTTKETNITASLNLYGSSKSSIDTGIGFFDHMLDSFVRHSIVDLELQCKGDVCVDYHHSVEDCGIVIGKLLHQSLYPVGRIERFGYSSVVMDEACVECSIDISNRAFFVFEVPLIGKIGVFDVELVEEFFRALVFNANLSVHIIFKRGKNLHHISEAVFKSFAVAFRNAIKPNDRITLPSTKGIL